MRTAWRLLTLAIPATLALALVPAATAGNAADNFGSPRHGFDYYPPVDYGALSLVTPPAASNRETRPAAWADGASDHPAFSQDNRNARLLAFDSDATNLVAGDHNGMRDVFVMYRNRGGGNMTGRL